MPKGGDFIQVETPINVQLLDYYLKAEEKGIIIQDREARIIPKKLPFTIYYLQHDDTKNNEINFNSVSLSNHVKTVSFSPGVKIRIYLLISPPVMYWQAAEKGFTENNNWKIEKFWGRDAIVAEGINKAESIITYKIKIPQEGNYMINVNLKWDNTMGVLKYQVDEKPWSQEFRYEQKAAINIKTPLKEQQFGPIRLNKGSHTIRFKNEPIDDISRFQIIDYFWLNLTEYD